MFSEYASRFLAQSQMRMSAVRDGRRQLHNTQTAPLFFSAADYPTDDREHEQEVSDFYALKSSRAHFGVYQHSQSEGEDDDDRHQSDGSQTELHLGNIKSSWDPRHSRLSETEEANGNDSVSTIGKGKGRMVDIGLDDSVVLDGDSFAPPGSGEVDANGEGKIPVQQFWRQPNPLDMRDSREAAYRDGNSYMSPEERPGQSEVLTVPQDISPGNAQVAHNAVWAKAYSISMICMFATAFVVWVRTDKPISIPLGDTIYTALQKSFPLLFWDTIMAVGISLLWMFMLRSFVRPLMYCLLVFAPLVMIGLSLYPFIMSFRGKWGGNSFQDKTMRYTSILPAIFAALWVWVAWRSRAGLEKAVGIIQLACKILRDNSGLIAQSYGTLSFIIVFSWIWVGMFARVFLNGHSAMLNGKPIWMLDGRSYLLGIYFVIMYLWTLGVASGVQRASTSATVSHWYFHRHAIPSTPSAVVLKHAVQHSTLTLFGSICLASFIALMIRLPLLLLPRRIGNVVQLLFFNITASPITALANPLTLTYSAIHSAPLVESSRQVINLQRLNETSPRSRSAYMLAKMLLSATRVTTSLALGVGAWITAARKADGGGSLYSYVVGLMAGCIGWAVLGATEGALAGIVDSCLVCVASEDATRSHCHEAQLAFHGL